MSSHPNASIPQHDGATDCETIDVLASDFLARYRDGERPTIEEYARRHPEFGDSIRRMFPLVASLERIKLNKQVEASGGATLAGRSISQLGDFRIIREIGRGGMGIVFEAQQESLGRNVAIKVLPKHSLLDEESLERFRREAQTAAAMHHAHIVPVYGSGESDGAHYLVMQLIRGESLDKLLSDCPDFPCYEAALVGKQVADAIAYAHASGVLHRDIKPANILIEECGTAQVTDFGLAKSLNADVTATKTVSGSLRYMAPERFAGVSNEAGDVYGIGITLYELLTGSPAFDACDGEHLVGLITSGRLKPIHAVRPNIPTDLATMISKAIHIDPLQRYSSAAELRDDLQRFLAYEPIQARRTPLLGRFVRWSRRNPKLAGAVGTAMAAMVGATVISTIAYWGTAAANQRTLEAFQTSEETVDLALQSLDGVVDVVSQEPTSSNVVMSELFGEENVLPNVSLEPSPSSVRILERLQPIYERLSQQSPTRSDIVLRRIDSSIQLARMQHLLGHTTNSIQTLASNLSLLSESGERTSIPNGDLHLRLARLNNELGAMYVAEFQKNESIRCYKAAILAASKLDETNTAGQIELARAHLNLGARPPQLRDRESPKSENRLEELEHINQAVGILTMLRDSQAQSKTFNILYAKSLLARSRLMLDPKRKRQDLEAGLSILRSQTTATSNDPVIRFELVEALADVNLRGSFSQRHVSDSAERLTEALKEIETLRTGNPDNAVYLATEVHLRHKLATIAKGETRFDEAEALLIEAVRLQTTLIHNWPENVRHRCWRAMLYRSQAELYHQCRNPGAERVAVKNANADMNAIDSEYAGHPLVIRTREAIEDLP